MSLRIARLLLVAAGALTAGTALFITVASQDRVSASPWLILLLLNAAGFVGAARLLTRDLRRARILAVGSAIGMAALGTITGFGAGMLSFPAAGIGAAGAWAALLHPPRRRAVVAFLVYLAIGIAISVPTMGAALLFPWTLPFILIWPARLLLFSPSSIVGIYLLLGIAVSVVLVGALRGREPHARLTAGQWMIAGAVALIAGAGAVAAHNTVALARPSTSARFELDPIVLGVVFVGGALVAAGALTLRLNPSALSAVALGLGATALFMTFSARPAVTCERNGMGTGVPLSWSLRSAFDYRGVTYSGNGSSGTSIGGGSGSVSSGRIQSGDRAAVYRCDGDQLIEFREVPPDGR